MWLCCCLLFMGFSFENMLNYYRDFIAQIRDEEIIPIFSYLRPNSHWKKCNHQFFRLACSVMECIAFHSLEKVS